MHAAPPGPPPTDDPSPSPPAASPEPSPTRRGFQLIVRFVRLHPAPFLASLGGGVMWAVMIVVLSRVLQTVTDRAIAPAFGSGEGVPATTAALWLFLAGSIRGLSVVVRRWFGSVTEARMQASLRRDAARRLVSMSPEAARTLSTGELLARTDVDVTTATNLLMPLPFSLGVVALIGFAFVSLAAADVSFAAVAVVMFPLLSFLSRYYTARIEQPAELVQRRLGRVSAVAHESFDGAQVVKTLGREKAESERFAGAAGDLRTARLEVVRLTSRYQPLFDTIPAVGTVVLLAVGAWRVGNGAVTPGELVQAVALFGFLAFPMRIVGFLFESLPRAVVSVDRVDELIGLPAIPPPLTPVAEVPGGPLGIECEGVSFAYRRLGDAAPTTSESEARPTVDGGPGDAPIDVVALDPLTGLPEGDGHLDDVSMAIRPGEVVALVGSTGSGKSTLIRLLIGLERPDRGEVRLVDANGESVNIARLAPSELRRAVATAFQESFLFADSIVANVSMGDPTAAVDEALLAARADGFVAELPHGADTVVGERGVTLSGGQRQRVALARALARRPRILLLDDATSAVDPVIERQILDRLRATNATMVIVAHRLSTIELCDRVVHLDDGRIVGDDTHARLLASSPDYSALVTAYAEDTEGESGR